MNVYMIDMSKMSLNAIRHLLDRLNNSTLSDPDQPFHVEAKAEDDHVQVYFPGEMWDTNVVTGEAIEVRR